MSRTLPKEVSEAIDDLAADGPEDTISATKCARLRAAILAALTEAREGALREAAGAVDALATPAQFNMRERIALGRAAEAILALASRPEPEPAPSTEDFCTCGHRRGEHNRILTGACGARNGPHAICDCKGFRAMAPRPWLAPEPCDGSCAVTSADGAMNLDEDRWQRGESHLCLGCEKLPPHSGSSSICPACAPPNGTCDCAGCVLADRYRMPLEVLAEQAEKFALYHGLQAGVDFRSLAEFARKKAGES